MRTTKQHRPSRLKPTWGYLLVPCLLILSQPSQAFELSLMPGYSGGGEFEQSGSGDPVDIDDSANFSIIASFESEPNKAYELLYSQQNSTLHDTSGNDLSDIRVHYLQVGGHYFFQGRESLSPYVSGGIGLSLFEPKSGSDQLLRPSMSLAIGFNWQFSQQLSWRTELRGYGTLVNDRTQIACGTGCNIRVEGDLLTQWQLSTGLSLRF
ncbi:outer membrane beta-barrel protein [Motiliproteus sp.]|uniref:outer membrane beta-barrel protein n=1 Tax=Motiliproteus sp. TaxID=1898955 RepID=UPI003BAA8134